MKKYESFDEALKEINERNTEEAPFLTSDIKFINEEEVTIAGDTKKYPCVFLDSVIKYTKLPKKNVSLLPEENLFNDINTLLDNLGDNIIIRFNNGVPITIFPEKKIQLKYSNILQVFQEKLGDEASVVEGEDFIRISSDLSNFQYNGEEYSVGIDVIAGERYKTPQININMYVRKDDFEISMPFFSKTIKVPNKDNDDKMINDFIVALDKSELKLNLVEERFNKIFSTPLNENIVRVIFSSSGFLPTGSKLNIFARYFAMGEDGKMTNIVTKEEVKDKVVADLLIPIAKEVKELYDSDFIGLETAYKAYVSIGSFFSENNKKFNDAIVY